MIVDPSADSDPVTANFFWTALPVRDIGNSQNVITYIVNVTDEDDTMVAGQSVDDPNTSLKIPGLPTCANLTATLVAERGNEISNNIVRQFSTSEPTGESAV